MGLDYRGRQTAGYVNQVGSNTLGDGVQPLLTIERSTDSWQATDGLVGPNMMATKLGGPLLSLNPHLALDIIESVSLTRGLETSPSEFLGRVENLASEARRLIDEKLQALA
jgi:CobQ-like glutamine amidotransferase family enzyme